MTKENQTSKTAAEKEERRPDYIAKLYRHVRVEDGWKNRKETIGAAWVNPNGSIMFRPNGTQVIDGDVYLFSTESKDAQ